MKKTLIFTDIHLHVWRQFGVDHKTGLSKRLLEQKHILEEITSICNSENISRVIFVGDLFHKTGEIPVEALNIANWFFNLLSIMEIEVLFVQGNHDIVDRETPQWFQSATNIFDISQLNDPTIKVVNFNDRVDYTTLKGYDLVVLHKTPIGSKVGNYTFIEGVDWKTLARNNKLVMFGHIHQREQLSDNCYIIGAPMHLSFGDIGDRGVYILNEGKLKFIKLNYPEFITVDNQDQAKQDGNYYRVLNATSRSEDGNIVNIIKPQYFEERIKSDNFQDILEEYLKLEDKNNDYLEVISGVVDTKFQLIKRVFKGRIKEVRIRDFFSIEDTTYVLENGFIYVKGKNGGVKSNGAGKSTLFEAIYWCFYNKTTKGLTGDDVIRDRPKLQEDAVVEVVLAGAIGGEGLVKRSRKTGLEVYKSKNDENPITQGMTQDRRQKLLVDSLLGIPESLYLSACYFSQENLSMLTSMGDSAKTNLITNMLGFEQYDDLNAKCHAKQKELSTQILGLKEDANSLTSEISYNKSRIEDHFKEEISNAEVVIEGAKKSIKRYNADLLEINEKLNNPITNNITLVDYDEQLKTLEAKNMEITTVISDLEIKEKQLRESNLSIVSRINGYNNDIDHYKTSQRRYKQQQLNLDKAEISEKCDKCGSVVTKEAIDKFKRDKQIEIEELENSITNIKVNINQLEQTQKGIISQIKNTETDLNNYKTSQGNSISNIKKINNLKFKQVEKQRELDNYKNDWLTKKNNSENLIVMHQGNIEDNISKIFGYEAQIEKMEETIATQKEDLEVIENNTNKLIKDIEELEFWKNAFSSTGIRSLLLDKFCNEFNNIVNTYIALISNGEMGIVLNPKQKIKSGEERNRLGLDILFNGQTRKYQGLSGGEKRRVDVSLCLGLNKWVSKKYGIQGGLLGILILDELFSYVDGEGEESIANLLYNEGKDKSVVVISHTPSLEAFASKIWEVKKADNITELAERN